MFSKKQVCPRCNNKTSKKHDFCPFCGFGFRQNDPFFEPSFNLGFPFNTIFKQLEKQIEKQFKEIDEQMPTFDESENFDKQAHKGQAPKIMQEGISISISSAGGQPVIKVKNLGPGTNAPAQHQNQNIKQAASKDQVQKITPEQIEQFSKLPKEELQTSVRRLTDKIVYELDMPDVKKENIIITRLQNSIEIKAFTKDKAFFKLIPISLPILKSQLSEGKLILELKPSD